jgi:hypothetical protein
MRRSNALERSAALGLALAVFASPAGAFDVSRNEATYVHGVFRVIFEGVLQAPPAGVEAVLLDYTRYQHIDPRIRRAELVARDSPDSLRVRTVIAACAGFFCRNVERVERFDHAPGLLVATIIPGMSDMRRGVARTTWLTGAEGTRVHYEAEFEPDFWVPSLVGHGLALRALRESTLALFRNVEREANAR